MSITTIRNDYLSFGFIRYFQSDRCVNDEKLRKFNKGKIKAKELITFDCGLMELKEVEETEINAPGNGNQLLAMIIRPEIEPNYLLERNQEFEFCGYDLADITAGISAITNCGAEFDDAIDYKNLNQYGLISSYRKAVNTQLDLNEKYLKESHTYCEIIEIWRFIEKRIKSS